MIRVHQKEAQYSYYLNITDLLTNLKNYIIPIDSKQKLLAPILTAGWLAKNDQEIVINRTYGWSHLKSKTWGCHWFIW